MMIDEITLYKTRGKTFDTIEKAQAYRADLIGEFFDKAPVLLGPGDRLKLNAYIIENRAELAELLFY